MSTTAATNPQSKFHQAARACGIKVAAGAAAVIALLVIVGQAIEHFALIAAGAAALWSWLLFATSLGGNFWGGVSVAGVAVATFAWACCVWAKLPEPFEECQAKRRLLTVNIVAVAVWVLAAVNVGTMMSMTSSPTLYENIAWLAVLSPIALGGLGLLFCFFLLFAAVHDY